MRRLLSVIVAIGMASAVILAQQAPPSTLDIYFIDTEGGQATLFVTPAGQMMLFDTGTGGDNNRDADRITDRKSTRLNSSHIPLSRMPSSA